MRAGCPTGTRRTGFRLSRCPDRCARPSARSFSPARRAEPAARSNEHNSMLVHVTRFQDVQNRVAEQVDEELRLLTDRIRYGDRNARQPVEDQLRALWERDFVPTSAWFPADQVIPVSWAEVWAQVRPAAEKIQVRIVNGTSRDALQYYEHRRDGLSVIAIGGNKLSRGLTLEGLSVSYYLRASKAYDTLLQMGRWFGYRPGYEDLCRLYTTQGAVRCLCRDHLRQRRAAA